MPQPIRKEKQRKSKPVSPGAALAAMRKTFKGAAKVMSKCPKCGKLCSARARRMRCPGHLLPKKP